MKSNKTEFDELDLKCLSELSIVLDVLSSSGNKIARIFKPLIEECDKTIKSNMPKKWALDSNMSYNLCFFPLTTKNDKKISIETLENAIRIESAFYIKKLANKKQTNFLWIYFGYYFSESEDENVNHYYFIIRKDPATGRYEGHINSNEFYKNVIKKNKIFPLNYEHPEKGGKVESFEINVKTHDIDEIREGFDFFKNEIIIPTLNNIK
jgi:hypothetical protein